MANGAGKFVGRGGGGVESHDSLALVAKIVGLGGGRHGSIEGGN